MELKKNQAFSMYSIEENFANEKNARFDKCQEDFF